MHLFFLDTESPTINVLYVWSGICAQWELCPCLLFPTTSSKSIIIFSFSFLCILTILLYTLLLVLSHMDIFITHHFVIVFFCKYIVCFTHKHLLRLQYYHVILQTRFEILFKLFLYYGLLCTLCLLISEVIVCLMAECPWSQSNKFLLYSSTQFILH